MNSLIRSIASLLVLLVGCTATLAQQPTAPTPSYTPPTVDAVQSGQAPLRVLMTSPQGMLAWKGTAAIQVISMADNTVLYTVPSGEQVGLVTAPETKGYSLRKDSKNFCPTPGAIRLVSEKPLQLWTPSPNSWTTFSAPLYITPSADSTFSVAGEMPLEEYLRNVVAAEMPSTFHPQALRAQAIIARTYALSHLGQHAAEGADLCMGVHCQAFVTEAKRTKVADEAVKATAGLVLYYHDKLAETYFHSDCGGVTDDAGYVWGPEYDRPYLTGVLDSPAKKAPADITAVLKAKDAYCRSASNFRWTKHFTAVEVNTLVSANLGKVIDDPTMKIAQVTEMFVEERTPAGRAATLRVEGDGASVLVYGDRMRWLFGNGAPGAEGLWSTLFELTVERDAAGHITGYQFTGAGRGHGLGLCQWGADGRAKAGQDFRKILAAYYPGTRMSGEKP